MPVINVNANIASSGSNLQSMVDECRDNYLYQGSTPLLNQLQGGCTSSATSLTFLNPVGSMITPGQRIAIDFEEMRVWGANANTATTVERGVSSSLAAVHAGGALVEIAPRFSPYRVQRSINEDIASLSGEGVFAVGEVDVAYNPAVQGYDLGNITWDDILNIHYEIPGPTKNWPPIRRYEKMRQADSSQFTTGNVIVLKGDTAYPGLPIRVQYRGDFAPLVNAGDDPVATAGLPITAIDIPILGAAIRLMAGAEIIRSSLQSQRDPMLLENVPPNTALNAVKNLMALRQQRLVAEARKLSRKYPKVAPL